MIKYLKNKELDKVKWDHCVNQDPSELPYAQSWFLDCICEHWDALVFGDYQLVMPLPIRKKLVFNYAFQPYPTQQLGVYGQDANDIDPFIAALPKSLHFLDLFVKTPSKTEELKPRSNFVLPLNKAYDELVEKFKSTHKRNIRVALEKDYIFSDEMKIEELIELAQENLNLPFLDEGNYGNLERLISESYQRNQGKLYGVKQDGKWIAGLFLLQNKNRLIYLFSVNNPQGRKELAMFRIIIELIKKYCGKNYLLDFEGSMVKPIANFFKGFGAEEEIYYHIIKNRLPWPIKALKG